jgi:hypothetical protein
MSSTTASQGPAYGIRASAPSIKRSGAAGASRRDFLDQPRIAVGIIEGAEPTVKQHSRAVRSYGCYRSGLRRKSPFSRCTRIGNACL